jgi:hypothetical protein
LKNNFSDKISNKSHHDSQLTRKQNSPSELLPQYDNDHLYSSCSKYQMIDRFSKLVQSIRENMCGPEWLAEQIIEEQEYIDKHKGHIFTPDSKNVE